MNLINEKEMTKNIITLIATVLFITKSVFTQCPNNNTYLTTITPTVGITQNISIKGGEYIILNVCVGATYTIETCGSNIFDSQITVYGPSNNVISYNDDACGYQSRVTLTVGYSGSVRVLIDEYPCSSNNTPIVLKVTQTTNCGMLSCNNSTFSYPLVGNYPNNDFKAWEICPSHVGGVATINFTAFNTENSYDYIYIYNGSSYTSPLILSATGINLPPSISGSPDSCLVVIFISDATINRTGFSFIYNCNATALPVVLADFSVICINNTPKINWSTFSEVNNDYFQIERSYDLNQWVPIANIPSNENNSNELTNYTYTDYNIERGKICYYRLKQVDYNGTVTTFPEKSIHCITDNTIYVMNKTIYCGEPFRLYDFSGRLIANTNTASLNLDFLSPGMYIAVTKDKRFTFFFQ